MSAEHVLIVDDEPQIRRAVGVALTGHGYDVTYAADGEDALTAIAARAPDAIILDLMMPGVDGLEVIRQLRTWSTLPIVVLSARGQEGDKVLALDLGADDYLTKPFGINELLARLRAVLRRSGVELPSVSRFGSVEVDLANRVVRKAGDEVHLTPTEYSLLRFLVAHPDKVLTHRQILQAVWGGYASENARQLRVYINYLRRKLEDDPAHPQWIVTDPGVGYRLRTERF